MLFMVINFHCWCELDTLCSSNARLHPNKQFLVEQGKYKSVQFIRIRINGLEQSMLHRTIHLEYCELRSRDAYFQ